MSRPCLVRPLLRLVLTLPRLAPTSLRSLRARPARLQAPFRLVRPLLRWLRALWCQVQTRSTRRQIARGDTLPLDDRAGLKMNFATRHRLELFCRVLTPLRR